VPPKGLDMIVAVYVANLLAHEVSSSQKEPIRFDLEFLQKVGAVEHLPKWRKMAEAALTQDTKLVG
jgi:hypothetical protein